MDFLSDIEKSRLIAFNKDEIMKEAVRKVLLASVYSNGVLRSDAISDPLKNGALTLAFHTMGGRAVVSNEDLGADVRALAQGVMLLEAGLNEISKLKEEEKTEEDTPNPAI